MNIFGRNGARYWVRTRDEQSAGPSGTTSSELGANLNTLPVTPDPDALGLELAEIRALWPRLSSAIREAVLAIARQAAI